MPCRHERHGDAGADLDPIVPIVAFGGDGRIVIAHNGVVAERRDDARAMRGRKPRQRHDVQMIVMPVR